MFFSSSNINCFLEDNSFSLFTVFLFILTYSYIDFVLHHVYKTGIYSVVFSLATDKVALLIGNLNYTHHPRLMAPTMDVHELSSLLQQLGFRVVSLLDLTLQEMEAAIDKFLQLLDRGVYGE